MLKHPMPTLILAIIFMPSARIFEETNALALICHPIPWVFRRDVVRYNIGTVLSLGRTKQWSH